MGLKPMNSLRKFILSCLIKDLNFSTVWKDPLAGNDTTNLDYDYKFYPRAYSYTKIFGLVFFIEFFCIFA
jgi:hypothetical protein